MPQRKMPIPRSARERRLLDDDLHQVLRLVCLTCREEGMSLAELREQHGFTVEEINTAIEIFGRVEIAEGSPDEIGSIYIEGDRVYTLFPLNLDQPLSLSEKDLLAIRMSLAWFLAQHPQWKALGTSVCEKLKCDFAAEDGQICSNQTQYCFHTTDNGAEWVQPLRESISHRKAVRLVYHSRHSGRTGQYEVCPKALFHERGLCYLRAWDCGTGSSEKGWKVFRLNRIQSCEELLKEFRFEDLPDLEQSISGFLFDEEDAIAVVVRFREPAARYIREHFEKESLLDTDTNNTRLKIEAIGSAYLLEFVSQFGEMACVEAPEEAVQTVASFYATLQQHCKA